jgi:hypothetical protein
VRLVSSDAHEGSSRSGRDRFSGRGCSRGAAYRHLPLEHQRQLQSTNPLERLNKEIKRRSNVVGIVPNPAAVIRLVGAVRLEQDDERAVAERRSFSADSMQQTATPALSSAAQEILAALA